MHNKQRQGTSRGTFPRGNKEEKSNIYRYIYIERDNPKCIQSTWIERERAALQKNNLAAHSNYIPFAHRHWASRKNRGKGSHQRQQRNQTRQGNAKTQQRRQTPTPNENNASERETHTINSNPQATKQPSNQATKQPTTFFFSRYKAYRAVSGTEQNSKQNIDERQGRKANPKRTIKKARHAPDWQ